MVEFDEQGTENKTKTERESILNNIATLASTPYGTVPFLRDAGVHMPDNLNDYNRNTYAADIIDMAETYEDRAEVTEVTVEEDGRTKVVVSYGNE